MSEGEPMPESNQELPPQPAPEVFEEPIRQESPNEAMPSPELRLGKGNCFEVLGLKEGASESEIGSKFRSMAMKYHPDHGGNTDDFKRLYDAYDKAKNASVNGLPDGVAPEATMAAGAGVAASGMEGQMNPEARKMAEQIWQASERVVSDESNVWSDIKKQNEAKTRQLDAEIERTRQEHEVAMQETYKNLERIYGKPGSERPQTFGGIGGQGIAGEGNRNFTERKAEIELFSLKNIIMPLAESGLLSQQETNEFLSIGKALEATMQGNIQGSFKSLMNMVI